MSKRELDAASITSPSERAGFTAARATNAQHGRSFYMATLLLQPRQRPYVHALYGFARVADDIVDEGDPGTRAHRFMQFRSQVEYELSWEQSSSPLMRAVIATRRRWELPLSYFTDFLDAMEADLTVTRYETHDDLRRYMWGSASVIALQVLPILGKADPKLTWEEIRPFAAELGVAFQLTNFLRDVKEDLRRGRIYLPQESLRKFGVTPQHIAQGIVTDPVKELIAAEIDYARTSYTYAREGIDLVAPESRDCLRIAAKLYGGILDEIEAAEYDIFGKRHVVSLPRRLRLAAPALARAALRSAPLPRRSSATGYVDRREPTR